MRRNVLLLLGITIMLLACKTSQTSQATIDSNTQNVVSAETIGHIKIGLIGYEIIDTSVANEEMAEFMIGMMKSSFEIELIYNKLKSAELSLDENNNYSRVSLYDRTTKKAYQFLYKDTIQYMSEIDINKMMAEAKDTEEDLQEISKMFKRGESQTDILGIMCDEVTMLRPPEYSDIHSIMYTSKKIPHMSEAMGPLSNYFTGAPLKTIMFMDGLKITIGPLEVIEDSSMSKYLELDESKYQKISVEEFEIMKSN